MCKKDKAVNHFNQAIVVGASSGMGRAVAEALARAGTQVALVARRGDELTQICAEINEWHGGRALAYVHDVHQIDEAPVLLQQIAHDLGGLDLIVYAAGILPPTKATEYNTEVDAEIIAINLVGALAWLNAAADRFQRTKNGTIVGISSVAGDRGRRGSPAYGASKAALTTYLESLRNRLAVHGVQVVTIKPGYVATPMLQGAKISKLFPVIPVNKAAQQILAAAQQGKRSAYVPGIWGPVMWLVRAIPSRIFRRLNV